MKPETQKKKPVKYKLQQKGQRKKPQQYQWQKFSIDQQINHLRIIKKYSGKDIHSV